MSIKIIITLLAILIAGSACRQSGPMPAATAVATDLQPTPESAPPQSFTIEFVDSMGNQEQVAVPPVAFPLGETQPNIAFEGDSFTGHVHMSSFRVPLAALTAVDLTHITEIALIFDQTPSGTLFWADLELVK
jgi:hypothetical protein